jgi:anti-sigma factor RsiW
MNAPDKHLLIPPHLGDAQIVAYLDGELARWEMNAAKAHLESCWGCRSRMGEVQHKVDGFLDARKVLLPEESVLWDSPVEQFRQRLARHASASDAQTVPFRGQIAEWGARFRNSASALLQYRKAVLASVMAICLLVVMFTDVLNTRVSADTVLLRASNYETNHLPQAGRVTRISVRVDRIDRQTNVEKPLGAITLVRDSASPVVYVSANSSSGETENIAVKDVEQIAQPLLHVVFSNDNADPSLVQYLTAQQWIPDISIAEFRRLVGLRGSTETSARRQDGTFELHYPFVPGHPSGIAETLLRVDAHDYAPTGLSIFTTRDGGREYRFTRTSFSSEPRTAEMALLLAPMESSKMSATAARPEPLVNKAVPLSYANSHATEGEVVLAETLHKLDTCLGEEINLFPMSDGSLLVQGLVDNAARRDTIRLALKSVSGSLRVEVYVPRELKSGSELYKPPDQSLEGLPAPSTSPSATLADLSGGSMPLHEMLYRHFLKADASPQDTDKQVALFSDEIVTLARQTFLHAWALERLDREFSPGRTAGLPAPVMQKIEQMRQDHRRWISTITHRQAEMLTPIAVPDLTSNAAQVTDGQDSDTLLRLAQEQNDLVRALFTTSQQTPQSATSLTRLIVVLKHLGT